MFKFEFLRFDFFEKLEYYERSVRFVYVMRLFYWFMYDKLYVIVMYFYLCILSFY